jgi:hypothetical protein
LLSVFPWYLNYGPPRLRKNNGGSSNITRQWSMILHTWYFCSMRLTLHFRSGRIFSLSHVLHSRSLPQGILNNLCKSPADAEPKNK